MLGNQLPNDDQNNLIPMATIQEIDEDSNSSFNMDDYIIFNRPAIPSTPALYRNILDELRSSNGDNSTVVGSGVSIFIKLITYALTYTNFKFTYFYS